jgi:hypothetical protein
MPADDQLAPMDGLFQVLVRRKPIAAFFRVSRKVPTTHIRAPDTAAISNPSKHKALPRQKNHRKPREFVENPRKLWKSQRGVIHTYLLIAKGFVIRLRAWFATGRLAVRSRSSALNAF